MRNIFDFIIGCLSIYLIVRSSGQLFIDTDTTIISCMLVFFILRLVKVIVIWGADLFNIDLLPDGFNIGDIGDIGGGD